jgi:hypothetical protein
MMAAGIARQSDDGKPRLERGYLQTEVPGYALFDTWGLDVTENVGYDTEGKYFCQNPCRWIDVGICLSEVDDEVFARTMQLCVYQVHRVTKFCGIDEIAAVGHPEGIAHHVTAYVDDGAANSHLNLLNLVED